MNSQWRKKEPVPDVKTIENCGMEELPEGRRGYKLSNGSKIYVQYRRPCLILKYGDNEYLGVMLGRLPLPTFAGEVDSSLYYHYLERSAANDETKRYTLCKAFLLNDKPRTEHIRKLRTENEIKFALQQPYFLELTDTEATIVSFEDLQLSLTEGNVNYLKRLESFCFFVWKELVVIVTSNVEHNETTTTYGDQRQICVISVEKELPPPNSVYCQDEYIYMICGSTLFIFKENLKFIKIAMSHSDCYIGGVDCRKLFLNTPGLFFTYQLTDEEYHFLTAEEEDTYKFQPDELLPVPDGAFSSKFLNEFTVVKIRGEGGYGCVLEVVNNIDNGEYAVKRVAAEANHLKRALKEVQAMAQLEHPGIVRYNATWIEKPPEGWQHDADLEMLKKMGSPKRRLMNFKDDSVFLYIQMQLCNYSLSDWLQDNRLPSTRILSRMKSWFSQIVAAVAYIHEKNLIHRDLKPSNILFAERNLLKLCDLGIATDRAREDANRTDVTRTIVGTRLYMSPEQCSMKPYSSKTDVFTLGLILAELLVVMTAAARSEIFDNFQRGTPCEFIEDAFTAKFIEKLTRVEPKSRPTCREMVDDLFLA